MLQADLDKPPVTRQLAWAGSAIGFGLGGFFDGILLHQILQWHHLLSGLEEARHDIRVLILTDGLFHVLMYVVACVGLWLLWRSRDELGIEAADRSLLSSALLGFGSWHLVDAVLSHWILGIHRIRMDVDNPLFWDLLWLLVFGVFPLVAGLVLRRRVPTESRLLSSSTALVLAVATMAPLSALPPPDDGLVMVMFRPGVSERDAIGAISTSDASIVWSDPSDMVWVIDLPDKGKASGLYGRGAIWVGNSILPAGCFDWMSAGRV